MLQSHFPRRRSISTVILTFGVILGLVLCYFVAIPFVPAIVGSFTLSVIFVPLDARIRMTVGSVGLSAAATVTVVALVVVVPAFVVIGTLLNEADRSAALIRSLIDSETWSHAIESRPRLAPLLRLINERFDIPELVKASTSWLAGWSGAFVQGSISGTVSLMLTFYFLFYLLRDREAIRAAVEEALPLSEAEFSRLADRVVNTINATVLGMAAVAILQGFLGGVMFWWLGLPAYLFWGVLMGLLAVVPFLGAFVIWAPAALFLALAGDLTSAAILGRLGHHRRRAGRQRRLPDPRRQEVHAAHGAVLHCSCWRIDPVGSVGYSSGPHHLFRFSDVGGILRKPDFAVRPNSYPTRSTTIAELDHRRLVADPGA